MTSHTGSTPRQPQASAPGRIEALATLPVFFKLGGRRVVLAGSGEASVWKAELLAAAGAHVDVYAPQEPELFIPLCAAPPAGSVLVLQRRWQAEDLAGAALAIGNATSDEEAAEFAAAALAHGVPCNVVDKPQFCQFQFGSIVNRSPLVIAISTDGAAPVFGQAVRAKIEAMLPPGLKAWAHAAKAWRPSVQALGLGFSARRSFWEMFTRRALAQPDLPPQDSDRDALMQKATQMAAEGPKAGRVSLVGAGPGDPSLLTIKALQTLQSADAVLYDDLVSQDVLDLARREALRMQVGKKGHGPSCKQDDINRLMVDLALEGKHVVRLKSGDPAIFGRAGEEIDACAASGVEVSLIPGISAAQGAAMALTASLTHREHAQRLQFLTGHSTSGELPKNIVWQALADPHVTSVVYMPKRTIAMLRDNAVAAGLSPDTPALAVMNASRPNQRILRGTIATLPDLLKADDDSSPAVILIGHALGARS